MTTKKLISLLSIGGISYYNDDDLDMSDCDTYGA